MKQQAKIAAAVGALLCLVGGVTNTERFFQSYLFAYLTVAGVALGALGLFLLYRIVGGAWGLASLPVLEPAIKTIPWLALLFVPVLLGMHHIFPWTHSGHLEGWSRKIIYLNVPFFVFRSFLYFGIWFWLSRQLSKPIAEGADRQRLGALGLLLYVLTTSFSAFDWIMSLEPHWASSIYGAMIMVGHLLSALAFIVVIRFYLEKKKRLEALPSGPSLDLGNLILAFVMLWAYMALSQYLIIWSGNLPEEIPWYLARQKGGWQFVVSGLVLFQFTVPFLLLLVRKRKQKLKSLAQVAGGLLFMRVVDLYWLVMPDFSPGRLQIHYLDFGALLLVAGLWMLSFVHVLPEARRG